MSAIVTFDSTLEKELNDRVVADQVKLLYGKRIFPFLICVFDAILYASVIWSVVRHARILGWLGAIALITIARVMLRHIHSLRPRAVGEAAKWGNLSALVSGANGIIWGSAALVVYPTGSLAGQALLTLLLGGLAAGATSVSASHMRSYLAFAIPLTLPLTLRLTLQPDWIHQVMALFLFFFLISMASLAASIGRYSKEAAQFRFRLALLNETLELRVAERTHQLRAAVAARDEFILVASHELKTPMTSMRLQLQLVERELRMLGIRARAKLAARSSLLLRQLGRLSILVTTLLDVSSMDENKLKLEARMIDLSHLIRRVATSMEDELRAAGSRLVLQLQEPLIGLWDPVRLEQIVTNLLSNATKYGEGRPIRILLQGDHEATRLTIEDHGMGFAPRDLGRIFAKYERASPARGYGGLGLGLFVVHQLVDAMGGRIEVSSQPGDGARFTLWLPSAASVDSVALTT